jgi:probable O-glycosylation ligase (exosortase A-associated)
MKVVFVYTLIAIGALNSLRGPFYALLFYIWIAYFRPDWQIGYTQLIWRLNLSFIVAMFMIGAIVITRQRLRFGIGPLLIGLFLADSYLTVLTSSNQLYSWVYWRLFAPAVVMSYVMTILVTTEQRLRLVFIALTLSLAFDAAKQGWVQFFIDPGGRNYNMHPMIGDNNGVAVGMFMITPLLVALVRTSAGKYERFFHQFLLFGVLYRGIVTYSRGGFLSMMTLGMHFLVRSKRKLATLAALMLLALLIAPVLPSAFWNRMHTIQTSANRLEAEETDSSIRSRIHFWKVAAEMVRQHPFLGVGFNAYNAVYDDYDFSYGQYGHRRSVHSVWFSVISEMGIPGFTLLVLLMGVSLRGCRRARRLARERPDCQTLAIYANAVEAALLVVCVGGTFVTFNNEMLWHFMAFGVIVDRLATERALVPATEAQPIVAAAPARPAFGVPSMAAARRRRTAVLEGRT